MADVKLSDIQKAHLLIILKSVNGFKPTTVQGEDINELLDKLNYCRLSKMNRVGDESTV